MEGSEENLDWCKSFLSDHANAPESICAHPELDIDNATIFGMICDTTSGEVFVSDGYPCGGVWERVTVPGYRPAPRRVRA
jgi:hypothetical protein